VNFTANPQGWYHQEASLRERKTAIRPTPSRVSGLGHFRFGTPAGWQHRLAAGGNRTAVGQSAALGSLSHCNRGQIPRSHFRELFHPTPEQRFHYSRSEPQHSTRHSTRWALSSNTCVCLRSVLPKMQLCETHLSLLQALIVYSLCVLAVW